MLFTPHFGTREAVDAYWRRLLVADWSADSGQMSFSSSLTLADLNQADFFQNTRLFLTALAENDGAPATAAGNLSRAFVEQILPRMVLDQPYRDSIFRVCKVINEQDVWPLHLVRVIAECAGLVVRRKNRFQLTKAARILLADDQAGPLYHKIFLGYFRQFELGYDFQLRKVPGIQQTMAVILWRLDTVARDWKPVRGLAPDILLPGVHEQLRAAMISPYDTEEWILGGYILDPLFDLGLIEREKNSDWPAIDEKDRIRVTALWRKFIRFEPLTVSPGLHARN